MWFLFVLLFLCCPAIALAQNNTSGTMAVDDPSYYAPSWTEEDEDLIIDAYIKAFKTNSRLAANHRILVWHFADRSGEMIDTEHLRERLQQKLSTAYPYKLFMFRGSATVILEGQINMDIHEADGMIFKNYTIWLSAYTSDRPQKQIWSKTLKQTHSQVLPGYSVGFIEDAK